MYYYGVLVQKFESHTSCEPEALLFRRVNAPLYLSDGPFQCKENGVAHSTVMSMLSK